MKRIPVFLLFALFIVNVSDALPKFATRQGAKCQSCHINPSGKGMRSTFGSTYGREELPLPTFKDATDIEDFSPSLSDFLLSNDGSQFSVHGTLDINAAGQRYFAS